MKKVLLTLFAALIAVPAFAVEVYNNGDNAVEIYGHIHGYVGYGMGMDGGSDELNGVKTTYDPMYSHNMLYGLQGNSRVGTRVKLGSLSGQFELGANEQTLRTSATNTIGFRQAWGAYTFANGSRLLVGKTDTPTAMGGFISSFYDTDGGLNGFGGSPTGFRRFQVQYSIAGLTLSLIEDDAESLLTRNTDGTYTDKITGFTDNAPYTPRAGLSYVYQSESLLAKIAATYTAVNGYYTNTSNQKAWTNLHAFGVVLGVKPTFGNMYVSVHARYGMNEDVYGEGGTYINQGLYAHTNMSKWDGTGVYNATFNANDGSFNNVHRAGAALEFGIKATENFTAIIGGGYQATIPEIESVAGVKESLLVHSYAVFLQGQYRLSPNFALVPEVAWFGTNNSYSYTGNGQSQKYSSYENGLLVGLQLRASF